MVSSEKRSSGNEWLSAMLIPSYKLMHLVPVRFKGSGLKVLFTFQVFVEACISLFSYFHTYCMNVSNAIPDDIKHFQQAEPKHYLITQTGYLKFASGN